jgi:hypothetical protein
MEEQMKNNGTEKVCQAIEDVDTLLDGFDCGESDVEVHVEDGILSARRVECPDFTLLGDVSALDLDDVEWAISRYLGTDGSDIAALACSIREEAKEIEAMAGSEDYDDCEDSALAILVTVHAMLVELRNKRGEE